MRRKDIWLLVCGAMMLPASAVAAQVVIDMPPPPPAKAAPAGTAQVDAASQEEEVGVGEVALARYRHARIGTRDTYWRLPPYRGYYSYYGPFHSWYSGPFHSGRRYPYLWGGFAWTWANVTIQCQNEGGEE